MGASRLYLMRRVRGGQVGGESKTGTWTESDHNEEY